MKPAQPVPSPDTPDKRGKLLRIAAGVAFFILFALVNIVIYFWGKKIPPQQLISSLLKKIPSFQRTSSPPTPAPSPTPTPRPIAQGRQTYVVRSSSQSGPQIVEFVVDPLDPKIGDEQLIDVKVKDTSPVTSVTVTLLTDNNLEQPYDLSRISGKDTDGLWSAKWKTQVKHDYYYKARIEATSARGTTSITSSFR